MATRKIFSEQEVARYRRVFNMCDRNKNGVIEGRELAAMAHVMGYGFDKDQVLTLLKKFDIDENGLLTFEEFLQAMPCKNVVVDESLINEEFRAKFREFDRDGNGYVSLEEAYGVLGAELGFSPQKTAHLLQEFDTNHDGKLSYDEFIGFYDKVKAKKEQIDRAFQSFDMDNKGYITAADAKRILGNFGFKDSEILALIRAHDTNQDGKLQYDEFINFWNVS